MALLATVVALTGGPATACPDECRVARWHCAEGSVAACIHRAALRWRVDEPMLRRKAWCESRFDAGAYNVSSGASGLFQFVRSTWATTPYRRHSVWSARWNALAAAWMHRVGRGTEWACR